MNVLSIVLLVLSTSLLREAAPGPNPNRYPHAELLVEAPELAQPEVAKQFRILDARGKHQYLAGHIPGAVWIDQIAWSRARLRGQEDDVWAKRIGELGI